MNFIPLFLLCRISLYLIIIWALSQTHITTIHRTSVRESLQLQDPGYKIVGEASSVVVLCN